MTLSCRCNRAQIAVFDLSNLKILESFVCVRTIIDSEKFRYAKIGVDLQMGNFTITIYRSTSEKVESSQDWKLISNDIIYIVQLR